MENRALSPEVWAPFADRTTPDLVRCLTAAGCQVSLKTLSDLRVGHRQGTVWKVEYLEKHLRLLAADWAANGAPEKPKPGRPATATSSPALRDLFPDRSENSVWNLGGEDPAWGVSRAWFTRLWKGGSVSPETAERTQANAARLLADWSANGAPDKPRPGVRANLGGPIGEPLASRQHIYSGLGRIFGRLLTPPTQEGRETYIKRSICKIHRFNRVRGHMGFTMVQGLCTLSDFNWPGLVRRFDLQLDGRPLQLGRIFPPAQCHPGSVGSAFVNHLPVPHTVYMMLLSLLLRESPAWGTGTNILGAMGFPEIPDVPDSLHFNKSLAGPAATVVWDRVVADYVNRFVFRNNEPIKDHYMAAVLDAVESSTGYMITELPEAVRDLWFTLAGLAQILADAAVKPELTYYDLEGIDR